MRALITALGKKTNALGLVDQQALRGAPELLECLTKRIPSDAVIDEGADALKKMGGDFRALANRQFKASRRPPTGNELDDALEAIDLTAHDQEYMAKTACELSTHQSLQYQAMYATFSDLTAMIRQSNLDSGIDRVGDTPSPR